MKTDNTITGTLPPMLAQQFDTELTLRCLTPEDRKAHREMSIVIYDALPSKELLIPMTEEEYDDTYREGGEDVVYGIFDDGRLVATSSLLHDVRAYAANSELDEILKHKCAEIGESMVLPKYRGHGLMLYLNSLIKAEAERQGVEFMLATAHPDNIASNTSLLQLGYHIVREFTRAGKRRNLHVMRMTMR